MVKVDGLEYQLSERKDKKLKVYVGNKWVHFGDKYSQNWGDKTKLLEKKYIHNDDNRRRLYLIRSAGIKDKNGKLTKDDVNSPNYHSRRILW